MAATTVTTIFIVPLFTGVYKQLTHKQHKSSKPLSLGKNKSINPKGHNEQ
jgi:hypothetical protein